MQVTAAVFLLGLKGVVAQYHYEPRPCKLDEVEGEILDVSGYVCVPRCTGVENCVTNMPLGVRARPQCMLKDLDGFSYCGLLCSFDGECPSGGSCKKVSQANIGVCVFSLSFSDWISTRNTKKLALGAPQQTEKTLGGGATRAISAFRNLVMRYGFQDSDIDVANVRSFLDALSMTTEAAQSPTVPQPVSSGRKSASRNWQEDLDRVEGHLRRGLLPGIRDEMGEALYAAEHLAQRGYATELLRYAIEIAFVYLAVGALYKSQMEGMRGMDMIPHIGFWLEYPHLVGDGIRYCHQVIMELTGGQVRTTSGGVFESVHFGRDRDTFGHFEPSK